MLSAAKFIVEWRTSYRPASQRPCMAKTLLWWHVTMGFRCAATILSLHSHSFQHLRFHRELCRHEYSHTNRSSSVFPLVAWCTCERIHLAHGQIPQTHRLAETCYAKNSSQFVTDALKSYVFVARRRLKLGNFSKIECQYTITQTHMILTGVVEFSVDVLDFEPADSPTSLFVDGECHS